MEMHRVLHAQRAHLLQGCGVAVPRESFDEWMAAMRFQTARDGAKSGLTPLRYAAHAGRVDLAEWLLELGADVEAPLRAANPQFNRSKHQAILCSTAMHIDCPEMIALLLQHGADPRRKVDPNTGSAPLHVACGAGHRGNIAALLAHDPSLVFVDGSVAMTPFTYAPMLGHIEFLPWFKAEFPEGFERMLAQGASTLGHGLCGSIVACSGSVEALDALLDEGYDLAKDVGLARRDKKVVVGFFGLVQCVTYLPPAGILGYIAYAFRTTGLHVACYAGNRRAVEALLKRGADINSTAHPKKMTPLILAALAGHGQICRYLCDSGAAADVKDWRGGTAATWAKRHGHAKIAEELGGTPAVNTAPAAAICRRRQLAAVVAAAAAVAAAAVAVSVLLRRRRSGR